MIFDVWARSFDFYASSFVLDALHFKFIELIRENACMESVSG